MVIIDVGGGVLILVDGLFVEGFGDLMVFDFFDVVLCVVCNCFGVCGEEVCWIVGDIIGVDLLEVIYDVWYDCVVFYFFIIVEVCCVYVC